MGDKSKAQKKRLAKAERQNTRVPAWVMMKTDMNVTRNPSGATGAGTTWTSK